MMIMDAHTIPDAWHLACVRCMKDGWDYTVERGSYVGQQRKDK